MVAPFFGSPFAGIAPVCTPRAHANATLAAAALAAATKSLRVTFDISADAPFSL
jgi:hypothetical protein